MVGEANIEIFSEDKQQKSGFLEFTSSYKCESSRSNGCFLPLGHEAEEEGYEASNCREKVLTPADIGPPKSTEKLPEVSTMSKMYICTPRVRFDAIAGYGEWALLHMSVHRFALLS